MTLEEWDHTLRNELALVFHACKAAWPHMVAGGGGSIVNVSGYSAHRWPSRPAALRTPRQREG